MFYFGEEKHSNKVRRSDNIHKIRFSTDLSILRDKKKNKNCIFQLFTQDTDNHIYSFNINMIIIN